MHPNLRASLEAERRYYAMVFGYELDEYKYSPNQPRVPAGNPEGGQWMSRNGVAFLARHEVFRGKVYPDQAGHPTIGYGHKLLPGEKFPHGITHEAALDLLHQDIRTAETAVRAHVRVPLTQPQFDAVTAFAFNIGNYAFRKSTFLRLLNQGDYTGAADEFSAWNKEKIGGVYQVSEGLINRRHAERTLFLYGVYP